MNLILYAIPFFLLAILVEILWGSWRGRQTYRLDDTVNSLAVGTLSRLQGFIWIGMAGGAYAWIAELTGAQQWPVEAAWSWIVGFVAYDLCYYWAHRMGHEVNLLWAAHVAHHQSEEYNLSTALRQTSTGYLTFLFYLPLFVAGIPAEVFVTVGSLNLIYQFWVHTRHVGKLGALEWVFITPSNHRVHHAQNDRYLDRNYGGVFILWDRLFGTFQEELEDDPPVYGIRHALHSWNPLWANLHVYAQCARDSWRTRRWTDKLRVWLRGPAWRPDDLGGNADGHFDPRSFEKYAPPAPRALRAYAVAQFVITVACTLALLLGAGALAAPVPFVLAVLLAFSLYVQGTWLEARPAALALELVRLALAAAALMWLRDLGVLGGVTTMIGLALIAGSAPWALIAHRRRDPGDVTALDARVA